MYICTHNNIQYIRNEAQQTPLMSSRDGYVGLLEGPAHVTHVQSHQTIVCPLGKYVATHHRKHEVGPKVRVKLPGPSRVWVVSSV